MSNAADNGPSAPDAPKTTAPTPADDLGPDSSVLPGVLGWLDTGVARIEAVMLSAGVLLMAVNTVANVIGRFGLGRSIQFTEEINSILIILITFAGISYAARHGRHIRMTAFFDMMTPRMRKGLMIVIALSTAAIMFGLAWYAWGYMITQYGRGRVLPSLQIPVWTTLVWVPVGLFMTGLQYLLTAIKNMIDKDVWLSTNVLEGYTDESDQEV